MSRTDVHAPYWTWAAWYEMNHSVYCRHFGRITWREPQPCNLPERPVRQRKRRRTPGVHECLWIPVMPPWRQVRWLVWGTTSTPPRWFVKHVGHDPERVRERDQLGKMVKEYNATGDLEDADFANHQSRHAARWLWD